MGNSRSTAIKYEQQFVEEKNMPVKSKDCVKIINITNIA